MYDVLAQMAALIACGLAWRLLRPGGLDANSTRRAVTCLVYYLLLPALVLSVLWKAPLGLNTARISFVAASGVIFGLTASWLVCRTCHMPKAVTGAAVLAAGFPNATYMGLPVLEAVLGAPGRSVAIQYDLFACTPLLLTAGIMMAEAHGSRTAGTNPFLGLLKVPPLWAALTAVALNTSATPLPDWLGAWLEMLGNGVIPLMLISLGMSLRWNTWRVRNLPPVLPVLLIQLLIMPLLVLILARWTGLSGDNLVGVVLEAAMPSMVLGIVLCDRFGLDTALYAAAVTLSTGLSLFSLPAWFAWVVGG